MLGRVPRGPVGDSAVKEKVSREEITDTELTVALLSPCLRWNERAICRGAAMFVTQLGIVAPEENVFQARRARGEPVVRHVAWLAVELYPEARR